MPRLTLFAAIAAFALTHAPAGAFAQAPDPLATDALPDVQAEAGRDLTGLHRLLNSGRSEFDPKAGEDGRAQFAGFIASVRKALDKDPSLAKEVKGPLGKWKSDVRELLLRGYLTRVRGKQMRETLSAALKHKTVGGADEAFGAWLAQTAAAFGLKAKSVGKGPGAGWEISVGKGKRSVLLATHVDVEDTDPALWTRDPWSGAVAGRSVHGRGATGGKAGLVAAMYALRTLNDSKAPLKRTLRLFVGTDGNGDRAGFARWSKAHEKHGGAFVLGVPFGPTRGENGIARIQVTFPAGGEPDAATQGWRVVSVGSTAPPRSVPTEAWAVVDPRGMTARRAIGALRRNLTLMRKSVADIQPDLAEDGEYVKVTFRGAPQPVAQPAGARNALADLGVFLADYLGLFPDHRGRLLRFLGAYVGHDTTCAKLQLDATHADLPAATCTPVAIRDSSLHLDIRWPLGRTSKDISKAVNLAADELVQNLGGGKQVTVTSSEPTLVAADDPNLVAAMAAYKELARRDPTPRTLPRATYARHLPGAVGFGPAPAGSKLHPGPNEKLAIEDLEIASRTYLTLLMRLATK